MTPAEVEAKTADLIKRLMSHMGLADMGDVLRDCREAADALSAQAVEMERMRGALERLRDCDWVITPLDRMDAVRDIARQALTGKDG